MQRCVSSVVERDPVTVEAAGSIPARIASIPICADLDDECPEVVSPLACFLHAPERGHCPHLRDCACHAEGTDSK